MKRVVFYVLLVAMPAFVSAQQESCRLVFYNVENLFDTINEPGKRDAEFLPEGDRRWDGYKYYQKLQKIHKALAAVKEWEDLTFIGLCEVENKTVVSHLLYKTPLYQDGYQIIHQDSPDERGVDVALLYRPENFELTDYEYLPVSFSFDPTDKTRDILYAKGVLFGSDALHLYVNHWPSRYGGYMKTKPKREYAAQVLAAHIDSVAKHNPDAQIIVTGDFNDEPTDTGITTLLSNITQTTLRGLLNNKKQGTTKFRSQWYLFDQIWVSENLTDTSSSLNTKNASIGDFPFLLKEDERYGGQKLDRTFLGPRYVGGTSDHLPVFVDIIKQKPQNNE